MGEWSEIMSCFFNLYIMKKFIKSEIVFVLVGQYVGAPVDRVSQSYLSVFN